MAVEKRGIQAFFQRADLAADGGLRQVQRLTRMGEAAGIRRSALSGDRQPAGYRHPVSEDGQPLQRVGAGPAVLAGASNLTCPT